MFPTKKCFIINLILTVFFFLLQYGGIVSIELFDAMPFLPLGLIIVISMFLTELNSVFLGLIMGIAVDCFSSTAFGFNTVIFSVICLFISLISHYFFNNNIRSCFVLSATFPVFYYILKWFIFYPSVELKGTFFYFVKIAVPSALFTAIVSLLIYLIEKRLYKS